MSDKTAIEWTDATWNPVRGCTRVSPGCGGPRHEGGCYAERVAARFSDPGQPFHGFAERTPNGGRWTGKLALVEDKLTEPLSWRRPRRIFVNSMSDLFHENLPDEAIDRVFAVMALCPQHTFQVLTKRATRMREYLTVPAVVRRIYELACEIAIDLGSDVVLIAPGVDERFAPAGPRVKLDAWPPPNIWLGISAEDQERADERVSELLSSPAAIRFVSAEPLLGPIDFTKIGQTACLAHAGACCGDRPWLDSLRGIQGCLRAGAYSFPLRNQMPRGLDWIIAGGESGPKARPMHPGWARLIRDQCAAAGVPFFFKQWGEWVDTSDDDDLVPATADKVIAPNGAMLGVGFRHNGKMQGSVEPDWRERGGAWMSRVGKKDAGRLLDGVEHSAYPEIREVPFS